MDLDHPILSTYFWVSTAQVSKICSLAEFKVLMRKTGVIFCGQSRLGKTKCCEIIEKTLRKTNSRSYITLLPAVNREGNSHATVIQQLANVLGVSLSRSKTRLSVFLEVVDTIVFNTLESRGNQFVLLIDELQRFGRDDFYQLADLYNALDLKQIKMTVISFAMPEIIDKRDDFLRTEQRQIISRFMSEVISFKGLQSEEEMRVILKSYDDISTYPEGSGITYTRHFMPIAYDNGFRLEELSKLFWRELNKLSSGFYVKNLPMEHFMMSIKYFLITAERHDPIPKSAIEGLIRKSAEESNLAEFCRFGSKSV
ncbi:ATP-binding protein [Pseudomonas cavernae]|uniref:ATP-binding protein n=1 Tax=Pseudomonas cavernae TaxID=2320867 RepID=A0A385Z1T7_9PSED|nr:ATP-binding protein [Pseudomonas cavernae]AYC33036.1 ATP-binding protein [Pseudomonas cavernae]